MDGAGMGCKRLRKGRNIVPFVSLQVIRLHAGQVAGLVPSTNDVKVFIETTGKEARPPATKHIIRGVLSSDQSKQIKPDRTGLGLSRLPFLHGRQLDPAVESRVIAAYKISAVFACGGNLSP